MLRTQVIGLMSAVLLFGVVLNLVRRRQLREEYSWLWLAAAVFYLVLSLEPKTINVLSRFFGIKDAVTTLTFLGLLFIVLILIHYSVKLSVLTNQMKELAQQIAILDSEQNKMNDLFENRAIQIPKVEAQHVHEIKNEGH